MDKQNDALVPIVKEINEADYEINTMLLPYYQQIMEYELSVKQSLILEVVYKQKQATVKEIAEQMKVSSSAVSQIISKLDKAKYVKREINPNNRREILVSLGEKGEDYFAQMQQVELDIIERYYTKLTMEEVMQLKHITLKLKSIVEQELAGQD
ncbi:MarR family transcriptional regulator [Paenibacillus sp. SC116]|uniref:MarR family winged helix-turn-helix transcriptional regulator n=1 Tax=Paenibacillus sp. SC116 TaxID=2968986 RepID=UPI00215AED41|nr:MarR family transcriptional regulator [Paenibacillus sp. SC116]MCR8844570.1 MarR family transcriptional regulator [Paenibacillus sp. SC116]